MSNQRSSYDPPKIDRSKIRADLSRNENKPLLDPAELESFDLTPRQVSQYPDAVVLQNAIAEKHGVPAGCVVVTAGGDEAIDRTIRVCTQSRELNQRNILTHHPTFEMFDVYASSAGGEVTGPVWIDGEFPRDAFLQQMNERVCLAALVSPNNPTGQRIEKEVMQSLVVASSENGIQPLVDLAYIEFADDDPTQWLFGNTSAVMIRSFSKAYGMAGLRLGYALTSDLQLAKKIRDIGGPFPVSQPTIDLGLTVINRSIDKMVSANAENRMVLCKMLDQLGIHYLSSQANFLLIRDSRCHEIYKSLMDHGVATRIFPNKEHLEDCLRITVPRDRCEFGLVAKGLGIESPKQFLDQIKESQCRD